MPVKNRMIQLLMLMCLTTPNFAQSDDTPLGQTIEINTHFHSFMGKPIWSLIIRDVDHNQNVPHIFPITRGDNHWLIFTYARHYMIMASNMQIETYQSRYNKYKNSRLKNVCQLESHGRISRGESMVVTVEGDLSPYEDSIHCNVITYRDE